MAFRTVPGDHLAEPQHPGLVRGQLFHHVIGPLEVGDARRQGVQPLVRPGHVDAAAFYGDGDLVGPCHQRAGAGGDGPGLQAGPQVQAEDPADPVALQHAALTQLSGAAGGLLRRLEEEEHVPGQLGQSSAAYSARVRTWRCGHRGRRHASARDGQRRRAGPWPPSPEARPAPPEMPRHRSSLRRTRRRRCGDGREHPAGQRGQNALDQLNRLRQLVIQLRDAVQGTAVIDGGHGQDLPF